MIDPRSPEAREAADAVDTVDWRNAYVGSAPGGGLKAWPPEAARAVGAEAIESEGWGLVLSPSEPLREAPSHTAPLSSEAWMGEFVRILGEEDGWWLVTGEDGYVAWMRAWASRRCDPGERLEFVQRRAGVFRDATGWMRAGSGEAAPIMGGTPLLLPRERAEEGVLELVDGTRARVDPARIERDPPSALCEALVARGRELLGAGYRWGGRSPGGIDCSGLVQWAGLRCGFLLPRDAIQQSRRGEELPLDPRAWRAGDLLFFNDPVDHVGIYTGDAALLHARARVREQALEGLTELMAGLRGARRLGDADRVREETLWRRVPRPALSA